MQRRLEAALLPQSINVYRRVVLLILESGFIYTAAWVRSDHTSPTFRLAKAKIFQTTLLILFAFKNNAVYIFFGILSPLTVRLTTAGTRKSS